MGYVDLIVGLSMILYCIIKIKSVSSQKSIIDTRNRLDRNFVVVLIALASANAIPLLSRAMEKIF